jgi:hypothetical protein
VRNARLLAKALYFGVRMKLTVLILSIWILMSSSSVMASCKPEKENGIWWIPEEGFTKSKFNESIDELNKLSLEGTGGRDFIEIENYLVMIRGYLYKDFLASHKKEFGEENKYLMEDFCDFLKTEAFYHH